MLGRRKCKIGFEVELFTIDNEGKLTNKADELMELFKGKKIASYLRPELSKSMIEIGTAPKESVSECVSAFLDNLQEVIEKAEKHGIELLSLGTHPGKTRPLIRSTPWYDAKKAVLGKKTSEKAGRVCGFHFHYTLPKGIISRYSRMIRSLKRSDAKDIFLSQYNFLVAADPALLTFCQSSPYWDCEHYAKDSRVLMYRDVEVVKKGKHIRGIHYYVPLFGSLPKYEFTLQDLRVLADQRKTEWLKMLEMKRFRTNEIACIPTLKFMWGPLRVNKIGTFEYRGPDMSLPSYLTAITALLKKCLNAIETEELEVVPSDIGITEPFQLEDDRIYVPPHSMLKYIEYQSLTQGMESREVYTYCKRLIGLAQKICKKPNSDLLLRIKESLTKKRTLSDEIIELVEKNGYNKEHIPEDLADYLALYYSKKLKEDIELTRRIVERCRDE